MVLTRKWKGIANVAQGQGSALWFFHVENVGMLLVVEVGGNVVEDGTGHFRVGGGEERAGR